jgi:hypothetical protein
MLLRTTSRRLGLAAFSSQRISASKVTCAAFKPFSTKWTPGKEFERKKTTSGGTKSGDFRPVELSYASFESKAKEGEKKAKDPLVILHSLLGRKKNWKTVARVIIYIYNY